MKIPYAMVPALSIDLRHAQMGHAVAIANARNYVRVAPRASVPGALSVACYGPSLKQTWQSLTRPIMSMSGATQWLAERGIVPDYHIDMDPRAHKAKHLEPPVPGVQYLMASVCPPKTWDVLEREPVQIWHLFSGTDSQGKDTYRWVSEHDPGAYVVRGHSTIGLTALDLGHVLGYRQFEIHGMDGSFEEGQRHAGVHYGKAWAPEYTWAAEGRTYHTTQIMANAVSETVNRVTNYPGTYIFHGAGLTQALIREANVSNACTADEAEKAEALRTGVAALWERCLGAVSGAEVMQLIKFRRKSEGLRIHAKYDTGAVTLETATLLRGLCNILVPVTVVEVGTFIGVSTWAMKAVGLLATCDKSNNCIRGDKGRHIQVHPYMKAGEMFQRLLDGGYQERVDLVFLDGRLEPDEVDLLMRLVHHGTVIALDDCSKTEGHDKGLANLKRLHPLLPNHVYIPPHNAFAGRSTLGALVPK